MEGMGLRMYLKIKMGEKFFGLVYNGGGNSLKILGDFVPKG